MAQRKANRGKKTRAKASRARTIPKRKATAKAATSKKPASRRAAPDLSRRVAELQAENRRLREELDKLRVGVADEAVVEAESESESDEDDIPTLGL
jgi:predicted RNase H-like nuclease (RuvC/YqgF family)